MVDISKIPAQRRYNRLGGRPGLIVDFVSVHDAVRAAWEGNGETTDEALGCSVTRSPESST